MDILSSKTVNKSVITGCLLS